MIGIVFVLITLRTHRAKQQEADLESSVGMPNSWVVDNNSVMVISPQGRASIHASASNLPSKIEDTMEIRHFHPTFEQ